MLQNNPYPGMRELINGFKLIWTNMASGGSLRSVGFGLQQQQAQAQQVVAGFVRR